MNRTPTLRLCAMLAASCLVSLACDAAPPGTKRPTAATTMLEVETKETEQWVEIVEPANEAGWPARDPEHPLPPMPQWARDPLPLRATGVVARVDGRAIDAAALAREVRKTGNLLKKMSPSFVERQRRLIVERLIDDVLIEALIEGRAAPAPGKVDRAMRRVRERFPDPRSFGEYLVASGLDRAGFRARMVKQVQFEALVSERVTVQVDDKAVREFYDTNKERYEAADEVKAAQIVLEVPEDKPERAAAIQLQAQALAERARDPGVDFADLARRHSTGIGARWGGELGWINGRRRSPTFRKAVFALEVGEVAGPLWTDKGWLIVKVHGKRPARLVPFEEIAPRIRAMMERQQLERARKTVLGEARKRATIERFVDRVEVVP